MMGRLGSGWLGQMGTRTCHPMLSMQGPYSSEGGEGDRINQVLLVGG